MKFTSLSGARHYKKHHQPKAARVVPCSWFEAGRRVYGWTVVLVA